MAISAKVGDPRGKSVTGSGDVCGGPLSPVVEGVGVSSVNDDGAFGEADHVIDLPAGGGSGENSVALEKPRTGVTGVGGTNEDIDGKDGGGGGVGHQVI